MFHFTCDVKRLSDTLTSCCWSVEGWILFLCEFTSASVCFKPAGLCDARSRRRGGLLERGQQTPHQTATNSLNHQCQRRRRDEMSFYTSATKHRKTVRSKSTRYYSWTLSTSISGTFMLWLFGMVTTEVLQVQVPQKCLEPSTWVNVLSYIADCSLFELWCGSTASVSGTERKFSDLGDELCQRAAGWSRSESGGNRRIQVSMLEEAVVKAEMKSSWVWRAGQEVSPSGTERGKLPPNTQRASWGTLVNKNQQASRADSKFALHVEAVYSFSDGDK